MFDPDWVEWGRKGRNYFFWPRLVNWSLGDVSGRLGDGVGHDVSRGKWGALERRGPGITLLESFIHPGAGFTDNIGAPVLLNKLNPSDAQLYVHLQT